MHNIERLPLDSLSAITSAIDPPTHFFKPGSVWDCLWRSLTHTLLCPDVRVWQRLDRFGNRYWQAYDPATGRSTSAGSEVELRTWIEELRYCK